MYISSMKIRNYRKYDEIGTTFKFQRGINVIIGENNAGKSSLIDALRLCLTSGQYRKDLFVNLSDFHIDDFGTQAEEILIDLYFEELTKEQGVAFYSFTNGVDITKAEIHLKYAVHRDSNGNERVKDSVKGGHLSNPIERDAFDNINLVYMAALRDAEKDLKPAKKSRLANLLATIAKTDEDKARLVASLQDANNIIENDKSILAIQTAINKNLQLIEKEELNQDIRINILQPTFESIAGSLNAWNSFKHKKVRIEKRKFENMTLISDDIKEELSKIVISENDEYIIIDSSKLESNEILKDIVKADYTTSTDISLKQNGLGYNNIISMATSLSDLQVKPVIEELSVFLVEEPEAHLHPQLLELVFNYLNESNNNSKVQMFLTSHSPALISKADIDSLNILHESENRMYSTSLAESNLDPDDKEDLKRYLDVTKSQLFFAKRVMFVEGITEAILLTEFAKLLKKPLDKYSVEIVNVNGVAFEPFAKLFAEDEHGKHLKHRCVIISDDDKCTNNDDPNKITKKELTYSTANIESIKERLSKGTMSYRAVKLMKFDSDNIKVLLANKTLEFELANIADNNDVILEVLHSIHPEICTDIRTKIKIGESQVNIAIRVWIAIRDCKGTFAQRLASKIAKIYSDTSSSSKFVVPNYIKEAIDLLIEN